MSKDDEMDLLSEEESPRLIHQDDVLARTQKMVNSKPLGADDNEEEKNKIEEEK